MRRGPWEEDKPKQRTSRTSGTSHTATPVKEDRGLNQLSPRQVLTTPVCREPAVRALTGYYDTCLPPPTVSGIEQVAYPKMEERTQPSREMRSVLPGFERDFPSRRSLRVDAEEEENRREEEATFPGNFQDGAPSSAQAEMVLSPNHFNGPFPGHQITEPHTFDGVAHFNGPFTGHQIESSGACWKHRYPAATMVDPWESVDLTMTCDSDGEASLAPDGEPVVNIPRIPVDEELHVSPAKRVPSLAQRFAEIYSRKCSNSQERSHCVEGISSQSQGSKSPSDPIRNLRVDSTFSINSLSFDNDLPEAKRTKVGPAFELDGQEKAGVRCEDEVIEIDDDSNDRAGHDACVVVSSDDESRHSTMEIEEFASAESNHWEEVDIKYHNGELHTKSPDRVSSTTALAVSREHHITSEVHSPKPSLVSEQLLDVPVCDKIEGSTVPQCNSLAADKQAEIETESIVSVNSESESDNFVVQSPPSPTYYCIYCEYSVVIEELYHKHIATHLPGTTPYLRMYCTECSYSTGSEKFLLFHMSHTHKIENPEFYRSGEERYTCRRCKLTQNLRSDIESHIHNIHRSQNQVSISNEAKENAKKEMKYRCVQKGCARDCKSLFLLRNHVMKKHKISPLYYYEFVPLKGKPSKHAVFRCFSCPFKGPNERKVRLHAKMHSASNEKPNVEGVGSTVTVSQSEEIATEEHSQSEEIATEERSQSEEKATGEHSQSEEMATEERSLGEEKAVGEHSQELHPATPHITTPLLRVTSPERHENSPKPHRNSSDPDSSPILIIASPEPDSTPIPQPASPDPVAVDDEPLVDMPDHDDESLPPPYDSYSDDDEVVNENDSGDSDYDCENSLGQPRTFYCIYCEYNTVIEEWYHKHIASHLPGTKPYLRMYCTECSYSTGSEKYLLFHMSQTHKIVNPEFYRSGEKRYTCRICRHTLELRIDIESHIKTKHKSQKQTVAKKKRDLNVIFQCTVDDCEKCYRYIKSLHSHVQKRHNIRFPSYYYECSQATGKLKLMCFSCGQAVAKKTCKTHEKVHFSSKQRRAPYLYYCPVTPGKSECPFSSKKRSDITEHYQSVHFEDLKYYKKRESTYACLNCPYIVSSLVLMKNHCALTCKNG